MDLDIALKLSHHVHGYRRHAIYDSVDLSCFCQQDIVLDGSGREILQTLKDAYLPLLKTKITNQDMWSTHTLPSHNPFVRHLCEEEDTKSLSLLNAMFSNDLTRGFILYNYELNNLLHNHQDRESYYLYYLDSLVNLLEFFGLIFVENVEQFVTGKSLLANPQAYVDLLENFLQRELKFPQFQPGFLGIKTRQGFFNDRHMVYLYLALAIKNQLKDVENPKICEIGGGCGLLAYYLDWLGVKDVTLVDIPPVSITSAYFLNRNLPHREFLYHNSDALFSSPQAIKLITQESLNAAPREHFDLVVNCDSMPEIHQDIVLKYLVQIKRISKVFYSINQEAGALMWYNQNVRQNVVSNLIKNIKGYQRLSRNLFWIRKGYVEELYQIANR